MIALTPLSGDTSRRPGETLELEGEWTLESVPLRVEARVYWYTEGKATREFGVVQTLPAMPGASGKERFRFKLPLGPYSCSGALVLLRWAVDLMADNEAASWHFTLGPDGKEVALDEPKLSVRSG